MVTMRDVRDRLDTSEVDYAQAAELGPAALPHLAELATGDDTLLASKAVYLASVIGGDGSASIVAEAAERGDPILRVAAAAALRNLTGEASPPLEDDEDYEDFGGEDFGGEDYEGEGDDWDSGSRFRDPIQ